MADDPKAEIYTEAETAKRAAATLKVMLTTPHRPHKESKRGASKHQSGG